MNKKIFVLLVLICFITNFRSFTDEIIKYIKPEKLFEDFYPIGWSKDGKFAYIKMQDGGGKCEYIFSFIITNTINDAILSELDFSDDEYHCDEYIEKSQGYYDFIWGNYNSQFIDKLNEFKIISTKFRLQGFPFKYKNDEINYEIDKTMCEDDLWGETINSIKFWIKSKKFGKKIIYDRQENNLISVYIPGFILSPFEDRMAVLMVRIFPGWEGPPNIAVIDVIGCHLSKGFQ